MTQPRRLRTVSKGERQTRGKDASTAHFERRLLCAVAQRLVKWLILERFIDEPPGNLFVDMCTTARER